MAGRIVIKLGGLGDVLRTTPILRAMKSRWPEDEITWVAWEECRSLLEGNGFVERFLPVGEETRLLLETESFRCVYSVDEEEAATDLASRLSADEHRGFLRDDHGELVAATPHADYALRLCRDDELKFRGNRLSYQEVLFRSAGLAFEGQEYVMPRHEEARRRAAVFADERGLARGGRIIGLNLGASDRIRCKRWPLERFRQLVELFRQREPGTRFLLLGGPGEAVAMAGFMSWAEGQGDVFDGGADNDLLDFLARVELCNGVVSADSFGMHAAIGLGVPVVALFGPTSVIEVDCYGRGTKISSGKDCSPCYRTACGRNDCMASIEAGRVFAALRQEVDFPPRL